MSNCYKCNEKLSLLAGSNIDRREECPHCFADIHCCMMCEFYDQSAYNECREPMADRHTEKEKSNFCDYFKLAGKGTAKEEKDELLSAAAALFKKK